MPTFEIPDGPTSIDIARPGDPKSTGPAQGQAVFNVTNKSGAICDGRLSVEVAGAAKKEWFEIEGERERPFGAGETQTATIRISIPGDAPAGEYPFRLRVVAVNDPDNDHAEGPVTTARLAGAGGGGGGIPWWVWLLVGLLVLAIIGGVAAFVFGSGDGGKEEPENKVEEAEAVVPNFVDQNVDTIAANAGGYQIIKNETANTGRPPRVVYDQDPEANTPLGEGGRVILSYEPGVVVPQLPAGATFSSAPNILRSAGLEPGSFLCDASSGSPGAQVGRVTAFDPAPGTRVGSGSKVNMRAVQPTRCIGRFIDSRIIDRMVVTRGNVVSKAIGGQ